MTGPSSSPIQNWNSSASDEPLKTKGSGGSILRRIGALVLNLLFIAMLLFSAFFHAANALVGTPQRAANVLLSATLAPGVDTAIATTACSDIAQHSTPAAASALNADPAKCQATIVATMHQPATRLLVRVEIQRAYHLIESGQPGQIDLAPLLNRFTADLYQAFPAIPKGSLLPQSGYIFTVKQHRPVSISGALTTVGWVLYVLGVLGAVLVARFLVRRIRPQLISVGSTIGVPAIVTLLVGLRTASAARAVHYVDPTAKILVTKTAQQVGSTIAHNAVILLVTDVVVVLGWIAVRAAWRNSRGGESAAS